jgi:diphthine-ammonia ligase
MKVAALFSGGKDSVYAVHMAAQQGFDVVCLLTMVSANKESYMYHTLKIEKVPELAKAMGIKLYEVETEGVKEDEVGDLMEALEELKEKEGIKGIVSGAIASDYQRTRIERICEELDLATINPLWHVDPEIYMNFLIDEGFDVRIVGVFADGLDKSWIGKKLDKPLLEKLKKLKTPIHLGLEGGEAETFVINGPNFRKRVESLDEK